MSLIPFILDLAEELNEFNRCIATGLSMDVDDFGFGIYPQELQPPMLPQLRRPRAALSPMYWLPGSKQRHHPYHRSKACCGKSSAGSLLHDADKDAARDKEGATGASKPASSMFGKNGFQVSMNVKQFAPTELSVKTIDNCIVVEGQHEEKEDGHGVISRHFIRRYMLPRGYDPKEVLSTLSSDGILTVKAPPPPTNKTEETLERIVAIQQTGPSVKDSAANKEQLKSVQIEVTVSQKAPEKEINVSDEVSAEQAMETDAEAATQPESEPEPSPPLTTNATTAAISAMMADTAAATTASSHTNAHAESDADANNAMESEAENCTASVANNVSDKEIENDGTDVPAEVIPASKLEEEDATNGVGDADATVDAAAEVGMVVAAAVQPSAAELVAAADTAILLAKTQVENGNGSAIEEAAN